MKSRTQVRLFVRTETVNQDLAILPSSILHPPSSTFQPPPPFVQGIQSSGSAWWRERPREPVSTGASRHRMSKPTHCRIQHCLPLVKGLRFQSDETSTRL